MNHFRIHDFTRLLNYSGDDDDSKVDMISNVFRDVDAVSAYDMVKVLAKLSQGQNLTTALGGYVTKTMKLFRTLAREKKFPALEEVKKYPKTMQLYKKFRVACTWKDVEKAFKDLSSAPQLDFEFRGFRAFTHHEQETRPLDKPAPEEETPEEAEATINILEHFEEIVERVIEEANDRDKWAKEAAGLEISSNRLTLFRFMGQAIDLMSRFSRTQTGRGGLERLFMTLTEVEKSTKDLPALMSAADDAPNESVVPVDEAHENA